MRLLPEERVRLSLLHAMIEELGYPKELLAVELPLKDLPHLSQTEGLPSCRADLLCMQPNLHPEYPLFPLLLVECKAVPLTGAAERQLVGYNHFVQAPFLALVAPGEMRFARSGEPFQKGFARYRDLQHIS